VESLSATGHLAAGETEAQGGTVSGVCSLGLESTASVAQVGELRLQGGRWLAQGHIASSGTEGQAQGGERSVKGWASAPEAASLAPVLGARLGPM
jgi:hypothetical protein